MKTWLVTIKIWLCKSLSLFLSTKTFVNFDVGKSVALNKFIDSKCLVLLECPRLSILLSFYMTLEHAKLYPTKRSKNFLFPSFPLKISWNLELLAHLPLLVSTNFMGLYATDLIECIL